MPRVTCRCGEKLNVQPDGPERIECPKCGAKIRLRAVSSATTRGGKAAMVSCDFFAPVVDG